MRKFYIFALLLTSVSLAFAGNPDRRGEAGAFELLLNPFARSAGLSSMNTAGVSGAEAMRINVAGIGRDRAVEVSLNNMQYLVGTEVSMSALGIVAPMKNGQAISVTLAAMSFGDFKQTTTSQPGGTGTEFSPSFFHIGIGYSKTFDEKISVGTGIRFINESIFNASASGFAVDAGVQYVSGENDNFKLGISLRNIGLGMRYSGDGINQQFREPTDGDYNITSTNRVADFELPFQLNIGASYLVPLNGNMDLNLIGNYTSNAYSLDRLGAGFEFDFKKSLFVRAGYNANIGPSDDAGTPLTTGLSAGITGRIRIAKGTDKVRAKSIFIDYSYQQTRIFNGTHNFGLRLNI